MSKEGLFHTWSKEFSGGSWWVLIYFFFAGGGVGGEVEFSTKIQNGKDLLILNITNSTSKY